MAYRERLKRQLVREAVRENLETIRGRPPQVLRRPRRFRAALLRNARLFVAPVVLALALSVLAAGGSDSRGLPSQPASLEALSASLALSAPRLTVAAAFPLGVRRIVLDPGHGGADSGARTPTDLAEKDLTLDVARRLRALLRESAFEVLLTRDRDDAVSLRERAELANTGKGDLFVSVHVNAIPSGEPCGLATYYLGPTDDPHVQRLAGTENLESGYSLADFRRLLEGVYIHVRQRESRQFAEVVQRGLVTFLARTDAPAKDNGVKTAPFLVLVATEMPGILAELPCLSNGEQARQLADPGYRQAIARGLFVGIRAYAEARNRLGRPGTLQRS